MCSRLLGHCGVDIMVNADINPLVFSVCTLLKRVIRIVQRLLQS